MTSPSLLRTALAVLVAFCTGTAQANPPQQAPAVVAQDTAPPSVAAAASAPESAPAYRGPAPSGDVPEVSDEDAKPAASAPVDPLQPEVKVDPNDRSARIDLWQRVRGGFAMPDLDGDLVRKWERYYAERPDYVQRMTERGGRYLFHIMQEVDKRGLPSELALLPFIESAFNPEAMSRSRASGMWQFMPATGRDFELKQNVFRDDRRSVLDSTRAALDYLSSLNRQFSGNWHLALAAYNWGPGNVRRAVQESVRAGGGGRYQSLRMPYETRDYVPKLQAVKNIVSDPARFGLSLPAFENHPYFLAVPIGRDIDVELAARLAGLSVADFRALNPQMNKPVILAAGTPQVLLPYDNANTFVESIPFHKGPLATWTAWIAPKTMKTAEAARLAGMSESELLEVNNIPPRMLVRAGSTLLVPRTKHGHQADVSERIADSATLSLAADGPVLRRTSFKVGKKGDTVASVAKRFGVSASQVAQWNKVSAGAQFAAGSTVTVFVPQRAVRSAKAAPAQRAKAKSVRVAHASAAGARRR